jgi:hypothetical protein
LQRRWQDGCRNLALVGSRLGVRYMLYPRGFLTQPVGPVKRLSTFALNSLPRRQAPMAKKNKRPQPKKPQRGGRPSTRTPSASRPVVPPVDPALADVPAVAPTARPTPAVARPIPRAAKGRPAPAALPPQDASIPLERVPYFRSDLRRIAITAGLMFVLLIAGSIVLRNLLLA